MRSALSNDAVARVPWALMLCAAAAFAADAVELIGDTVAIERGQKHAATAAIEAQESKRAVLVFEARLEFASVAGYNNAMRVTVNGRAPNAAHLINKPLRVKARSGDVYSMVAGEWFSVYYSPDFTSPDADPHYGLAADIRPCLFELDISDLLRPGENEIVWENMPAAGLTNLLVVGKARIEWRDPAAAKPARKGPPEGPLDRYRPRTEHRTEFTYDASQPGEIAVDIGYERFTVSSRFSVPGGAWVSGANDRFDYERSVERRDEALLVRETFVNRGDTPLGIMQRHGCALGPALRRVWLSGLEQPDRAGAMHQPANPTTFAATDKRGIGLLPLSDAFRIHVANSVADNTITLEDNHLVIAPKARYTAEWAIVPADMPDYFTFLNAARRLLDANFTIDGGFAFLRCGPPVNEWTEQQLAAFIELKDVRYTCASNDYPRYEGRYTHGIAFQRVDHAPYVRAREQRKRLAPDTMFLVYFHCFLDVTDDGPIAYADARVLLPDGSHAVYGEPHDRIYFPTESNTFGREIGKNVDIIHDTIGADGVYWDEHEYSRYHYHYGEPWDGLSGDIDPATHEVVRLKSSVTLLTESWRLALAKRIMARGPLIGNGPPVTRARAALQFPCFVETGSITNCTQSHLHTPIALGDHLTEYSETDAYGTMVAALDYGCVYHWYNDVTVVPTRHTLTRYMYPFTPIELHEGYVIGKERILTNRSGLFGWGDAARHEAHVFDERGVERSDVSCPTLTIDGATFSEVRIGEGWSAAIVRK